MDLARYQLPLSAVPTPVAQAISRGVQRGEVPLAREAAAFLNARGELPHAVTRGPDGRLFVTTSTFMPDVTPVMIDWWFGWHLPQSARYRLWHPQAHVGATVKEDRSARAGSRDAYVNNVSYVDEYIGETLMKLAIGFLPPAQFGFADAPVERETVVCARTADREKRADAGFLLHRVQAVPGGSRMQSLFWLGEIRPHIPVVGGLLAALLNTPRVRNALVPEVVGLALLRHCAEEMNHLPKFLPRLYADVHSAPR